MNFMHTENRIIEDKYANSCGSTICPFQIVFDIHNLFSISFYLLEKSTGLAFVGARCLSDERK